MPLKHYNDVKAVGRAIFWIYSSCNARLPHLNRSMNLLVTPGLHHQLATTAVRREKAMPNPQRLSKEVIWRFWKKTPFSSSSSPSALWSLSNPRHSGVNIRFACFSRLSCLFLTVGLKQTALEHFMQALWGLGAALTAESCLQQLLTTFRTRGSTFISRHHHSRGGKLDQIIPVGQC